MSALAAAGLVREIKLPRADSRVKEIGAEGSVSNDVPLTIQAPPVFAHSNLAHVAQAEMEQAVGGD